MRDSYRLISLWDMLTTLKINRLWDACGAIHLALPILFMREKVETSSQHIQVTCDFLLKMLSDFTLIASEIGLPISEGMGKKMSAQVKSIRDKAAANEVESILLPDFNDLWLEFNAFDRCIPLELETRIALVLPPAMAGHYEKAAPFGEEMEERFSSASYDIAEASKCLALGRTTSTVFHCMRIVERGLRAINSFLGLQDPDNPNWGAWLNQIRVELDSRKKKWEEYDYFYGLYAQLQAIKTAQRNQTMHPASMYVEEEAKLIFDNTKFLMMKIVSRIDEHGSPRDIDLDDAVRLPPLHNSGQT
jgi:HEPN domain-containing protein